VYDVLTAVGDDLDKCQLILECSSKLGVGVYLILELIQVEIMQGMHRVKL
jgi:hypothetical protein